MVASVACMAGVRDLARRADLEAAGFRVTPWVVPQWGAIALFAVFLAAAAVTVGWMLRKMMKAAPGDPARGGPPTR
jgi:ribosomal protein S12 methylthiotransferase accessory factor YcaO